MPRKASGRAKGGRGGKKMPKVAESSDGERAAKCHLLASVCFDVLFLMEALQIIY